MRQGSERNAHGRVRFKLPDVGEGLTEAEIVTWRVKEGDTVAHQAIVEIETAKSLVELPSPFAGSRTAAGREGETVPVGTPIIAIGRGDTAAPKRAAVSRPGQPRPDGGRRRRRPAGREPARPRSWSATAAGRVHQPRQASPAGTRRPSPAEVPSSPRYPRAAEPRRPPGRRQSRPGQAARPQAGQGPRRRPRLPGRAGQNGAVTREDVEWASVADSPVRSTVSGDRIPLDLATAAPGPGGEEREPIKGVRRMMGQAMVSARSRSPTSPSG